MTARKPKKKIPVTTPAFATYEEEAAWWDKHGPSMPTGDPSEWEALVPSPHGRSVYADDPEVERLRAIVKEREAETDLICAVVRAAVVRTAKKLAPRASPLRIEMIVAEATEDALRRARLPGAGRRVKARVA